MSGVSGETGLQARHRFASTIGATYRYAADPWAERTLEPDHAQPNYVDIVLRLYGVDPDDLDDDDVVSEATEGFVDVDPVVQSDGRRPAPELGGPSSPDEVFSSLAREFLDELTHAGVTLADVMPVPSKASDPDAAASYVVDEVYDIALDVLDVMYVDPSDVVDAVREVVVRHPAFTSIGAVER